MKKTVDKLVAQYFYLVELIAFDSGRSLPKCADPHVLLSGGMAGLLYAACRHQRGKRFESYARCSIRWGMREGLRANDWLSRLSRSKVNKGDSAGPTFVGVDDDHLLAIMDPGKTPSEAILQKERTAEVKAMISSLEERHQQILLLHYFKGMEFYRIGKLLGLSSWWVILAHRRVLEELRAGWSQEKGNLIKI